MALAAAQHHSAPKSAGPVSHNVLRNQNTAREGTKFYAMSEDSDVVGGCRPPSLLELRPQERVLRHTAEQIGDVAPVVPALGVPEPQMVDQLVAMIKVVGSVVPEQIIAVPKISWPSRFPRTVLREPQKAEQLVEVPVPAPSFSDWVLWEETHRRTRLTWLGGFEWRLILSRGTTASPGRYINTGQGPRRRPWYRAASVPAVEWWKSWLWLSRKLRTVHTLQFWGVSGTRLTAATSSSSSSSVVDVPVIMQQRRSWLRITWFDCGYIFCVSSRERLLE